MNASLSHGLICTLALSACSGKLIALSTLDGGSMDDPSAGAGAGGTGAAAGGGTTSGGPGGKASGDAGWTAAGNAGWTAAGGAAAGQVGASAGFGGVNGEGGGVPAGGGAGSGGTTVDCGFAILSRPCSPSQDTFAKCKSCSGFTACHGKDMPSNVGLDLTAEGIGDGTKYINYPADDSVTGSCGASAVPTPITGKVYIDPRNPEQSLLYTKVTTTFGCGSRMPFASTVFLSPADQQCILDWIKNVPGVTRNSAGGLVDAGGGH